MNTGSLTVNTNNTLSAFFAEQFANLTPWTVSLGLIFGLVVGLIIAFVYKRCYRGVLYSPNFAITLIMMTLITTPVVMCIGSNIALSMGMVGALSIVRFRTAVKDPLDTAYMFWALTMGILLGAELYLIAFVVVHVSYKRRRYSGQTALLYFAFLGVYTMLTKGLAVSVRRWNEAQCMGLLIFAVALIALIVCARRVRNPEMEINGSIPELRTFTRPMTAQEKAAKREADVLWASEMLDRKVEDALDELNGKKS